jgi:hypothetical protein
MAEIRNYTMNFGYHITSMKPMLVSAATSRIAEARGTLWPEMRIC